MGHWDDGIGSRHRLVHGCCCSGVSAIVFVSCCVLDRLPLIRPCAVRVDGLLVGSEVSSSVGCKVGNGVG